MTTGRVVAGILALLGAVYYIWGEFLINLYPETLAFHAGWIVALTAIWYRAVRPSKKVLPNAMTLGLAALSIWLAGEYLNVICQSRSEETCRIATERLGVPPGDFGTERDLKAQLWMNARYLNDPDALQEARSVMIARSPGWCRAAVALAASSGREVPRVINWTADQPLFLCGYVFDRGLLPFPRLGFIKARLSLEKRLLATAEELRGRMLEDMK